MTVKTTIKEVRIIRGRSPWRDLFVGCLLIWVSCEGHPLMALFLLLCYLYGFRPKKVRL